MAVQEVNNCSDTVDNFFHLYETGDLSDIEIKVGNKKFKTHRLVLCMASDVLKAMLMNKFWPEGRSDRVVLREDPECVEVFQDFLCYLYTGRVRLNKANVLPLITLADKYNVSHLSKSSLKYMRSNCCQETIHFVVSWLQYAIICGYKDIEEKCKQFITSNFDSVMRIPEFLDLSKDVLVKFLESSDIVVKSEYSLYIYLKNWITHNELADGTEGNKQFHSVMKHVRFPMMHLQEIILLEKDVSSMTRYKDLFLKNIFLALRYHTGYPISLPDSLLQALIREKQFIPRIYPKDTWSTEIYVENVSQVMVGEVRGAFFSTPISYSDSDQLEHHDWNVMFYPKGVQYDACVMIGVPMNLMNPGGLFRTVRLAFCTNCQTTRRFKISVLVMGRASGKDDFVYSSITKDAIFDNNCSRFNFENVIPFEEISNLNSPYKVKFDTIRIKIVIRPVDPMCANR